MKNKIFFFLFLFFLASTILAIDVAVKFSLIAKNDPSGDSVWVRFKVAKDSLFTQLASTDTAWVYVNKGNFSDTIIYKTIFLPEPSSIKKYFWQTQAKDQFNYCSEFSPITSFFLKKGEPPLSPFPFYPEPNDTLTGSTWCGDVNYDGVVDIGDIIYLLEYVFYGGTFPVCGAF